MRLVVKHIPQKGFKYLEFKLFDVSELDEESLAEEASFSDKRDLAKQLETSEEQIDELLSEQGFKTLEDFTDKGMKNAVDLSYQIKDLEKRKLQGLSKEMKSLVQEFTKLAVDEAGGFADFRESATKTNSVIDRLDKLTLPKLEDVEQGPEKFVENREEAEALKEEIQETDELIDAIVFDLYDLTEEEVETVLDSLDTEKDVKASILEKFREVS